MDFREHHLFQVLKRFNHSCPLDLFLSRYYRENKALGAKDRRFISDAIYGMIRWQALLDHLLPPTPTWERRFFLYRNLDPQSYENKKEIPPFIRFSIPESLFSMLKLQYGEAAAIELAKVFNTEAPITVRVNSCKTSRDILLTQWEKEYGATATQHSPIGILFPKRYPLFETEEFKTGLFEMQDEASQLVAEQVEAKPKERILDYCSGSGGKSLSFAYKLQGTGQIYLHDIREPILAQARKRLKRAGVQNVQLLSPHHPYLTQLKEKMDWVLTDVPCSGTGTLRRNPEMKGKFSQESVAELVALQRAIVTKAISYCKKGGKLVYATCSILREENENQIDYFLNNFPLQLTKPPFVSLPSLGGMDGFFAATFTRS